MRSNREFEALQKRAAAQKLPKLPDPLANGNYPATETIRVIYARRLIQERESAGLSQSELARRAGIRPETINRLEKSGYGHARQDQQGAWFTEVTARTKEDKAFFLIF